MRKKQGSAAAGVLCALCLLAGCTAVSAREEVSTESRSASTDSEGRTFFRPTANSRPSASATSVATTAASTCTETAVPAATTAAAAGKTADAGTVGTQVLRLRDTGGFPENTGNVLTAQSITDAEAFARFCDAHKGVAASGSGEEQALTRYDASFFAGHSLIAVYIGTSSGSYRFGLDRMTLDGDTLRVFVRRTNPTETGGTGVRSTDMASWLMLIEVKNGSFGAFSAVEAQMDTGG